MPTIYSEKYNGFAAGGAYGWVNKAIEDFATDGESSARKEYRALRATLLEQAKADSKKNLRGKGVTLDEMEADAKANVLNDYPEKASDETYKEALENLKSLKKINEKYR